MATAVVTGVFGLAVGLGANISDEQHPPSPTTETRSQCVSAFTNVKEALAIGIGLPELLEAVNPESVDRECGEESDIAEDLDAQGVPDAGAGGEAPQP
ncbi:hypothetical protein [Nocardioides lijunqiniae]|uniref:hypothetical protein n=1 Tax=Nocardioides lijunqiniae TaxID=2760832 RepID=UPI0018775C76|nr:hypothetical protein [Nocardioides lijunqiniae]